MLRNDKKSLSRSLKALFYRLSWSKFTFSPTIFHRRPPFYFFVWVENRHFRRTKALFRSRIYAFYKLLEQFCTALMTFEPFRRHLRGKHFAIHRQYVGPNFTASRSIIFFLLPLRLASVSAFMHIFFPIRARTEWTELKPHSSRNFIYFAIGAVEMGWEFSAEAGGRRKWRKSFWDTHRNYFVACADLFSGRTFFTLVFFALPSFKMETLWGFLLTKGGIKQKISSCIYVN